MALISPVSPGGEISGLVRDVFMLTGELCGISGEMLTVPLARLMVTIAQGLRRNVGRAAEQAGDQ
jgi:hypothetical protein